MLDPLWISISAPWAESTTAAHLYRFIPLKAMRLEYISVTAPIWALYQPSLIIIVQRWLFIWILSSQLCHPVQVPQFHHAVENPGAVSYSSLSEKYYKHSYLSSSASSSSCRHRSRVDPFFVCFHYKWVNRESGSCCVFVGIYAEYGVTMFWHEVHLIVISRAN